MKNKIFPVGHKILCKKLSDTSISETGMQLRTDSHGNVQYEIVALPDPIENPWIAKMKIGDIVICKDFDADCIRYGDEEYYVLDVNAPNDFRAGQVHAIIKK